MKYGTLLIAVLSGLLFFVFQQGPICLGLLLVLTAATRFRPASRNLGKFVEILFVFLLISLIINELGIAYPYSLIIVLTGLVVLIFYEGPEWSKLFFVPGETQKYFKQSLAIAGLCIALFGGWVYFRGPDMTNPVPLDWPIDALIIVGIGFAFYKAVVEEMIFRSFIYQRAQSTAGRAMAVPAQGVFYALMHYRVGAPTGIEGVVFGGCVGLGLGYLVYKTGSIYLSMLVQFLVTLGIFCILIFVG